MPGEQGDNPHNLQYDSVFTQGLQWIWGEGWMSPGGPAEVTEMLRGTSLAGLNVLDVGSGLGGVDTELVSTHGAASVVGIDVEPPLVEQARARTERLGLSDRIRYQLVAPGPLPFDDATFDAVFTKDAVIHIPDKLSFYADVLRVLRPGGVFVGSDWLRGGAETRTQAVDDWFDSLHLAFEMRDQVETRAALESAGFEEVALVDRNAWYREEIVNEIAAASGENFERLVSAIGREAAEHRRHSSVLKQGALKAGFLRPTHFRATRATS